ncbi:MAG: ABC transporter ATP-binding protein [Bacteroidota bacterium]|nr:ABC transporter ATP-binding protein [Bacteroidota bacterium]MEC8678863.1 ABC transporter ATP-binding protein [Bacteroidota bacterium]MEC8702785.1 ABC transporter ATP-binding protein [Bacteroidota bacterium]|tara:strand:- start:1961 stop:3724 length:1764 start_codon:yes stop_codon:yes gene_type:complete
MSNKNISGNLFDLKILNRLFIFCKPYMGVFYVLIFLTLSLSILQPIRPYITQIIIDDYVSLNDLDGLKNMIFLLFGLLIINAIVMYFHTYLSGWLGQNIIKDIRIKLFSHLQNFKLQFFDKTPIGRIVTRNVSDIETIADIFGQGIAAIIGDILQLFGIVVLMFYINWKLTLISLATLPFLFLTTYIFKEKVKLSFNNVRNAVANLNSYVQEHIIGMNIVQIFGNEEKEYKRFKDINETHLKANLKAVLYYSIYFPVMELFTSIGLGLLIWYGSNQLFSEEVTLGVLVAFIMYLQLFFRPIRSIADRFNTLQMGVVSSKRIFDLLDRNEEIDSNEKLKDIQLNGDVEFKDVWFAYNDEEYVLKNISFKINSGESVGFVGSTGSGKTSIINLINRFYDFQKGTILVDGNDIKDYNLSSLRSNLGMVSQDVFLFSDSIYNNITLFNDSIKEDEVWNAIKKVGAEKFINKLPNGLQFDVKERGISLSVGQRQLISCIRIMLYDPKIILLDEATSSIDSESETMIQKAISEILKNRTSIVVAHRLSTIKEVDKIVVIDSGEIKEIGNHKDLIQSNGFYKKLYEMQYKNIAN